MYTVWIKAAERKYAAMKTMPEKSHITGQTQDAGFQIGVRRTFDISPETAWSVLTSASGLRLWLGDITRLPEEKRAVYRTADGTTGEIRAFQAVHHVRLSWQPTDWEHPSILQVRVIPTGAKTTLSFHQERLDGPQERARMAEHWKQVIEKIAVLFK